MKIEHTGHEMVDKFRWTIDNFSQLDSKELYSESFFVDGHAWRIVIYPKGDVGIDGYLSIELDAGDLCDFPECWTRLKKLKLALINQVDWEMTEVKETTDTDEPFSRWVCPEFISLDELCDPECGFIVNDTCVVEARIYVNKLQEDQTGELVDFKGFGKIEKAFVPFLEEVCSWHPSLVESHKKRSRTRMFNEWAFTALGRFLHFLKTKKVKDMYNDDARNQLQVLWEELETFGFDLVWLKPRVQSALDMKSYNERAIHAKKKPRKNVDPLEMNLKIATGQKSVKAEEGFEERDLDAELGYGGS